MSTSKLRVQGLNCADEAAELRQTIGKLPGVRELSFDDLRGLMFVDHDESVASTTRLMKAAAGMRAEIWRDDALKTVAATDDGRWWRSTLTVTRGVCLAAAFACD